MDIIFSNGQSITIPKGLIFDQNNNTLQTKKSYRVNVIGPVTGSDTYVKWTGEKGRINMACLEDILMANTTN